jgi:hypothetical protein
VLLVSALAAIALDDGRQEECHYSRDRSDLYTEPAIRVMPARRDDRGWRPQWQLTRLVILSFRAAVVAGALRLMLSSMAMCRTVVKVGYGWRKG